MNIAFKIEHTTDKNVALHLLTEVSDTDISFFIFSKDPFKIEGLYCLNFERNTSPSIINNDVIKYLEETPALHESTFSTSAIFYNTSTSTLVPDEYFKEEDKQEILDQLFVPDRSSVCFHELCKHQPIYNIYSVPSAIHNSQLSLYPSAVFFHSTSYQLAQSKNTLYCIVYSSTIKVIFFKENELQIVQFFEYLTPTDVCYHLLNVAARFETDAASIQLLLSGMIDLKSTLYNELYKYFLLINFATEPDVIIADGFDGLPPHFYHHLTALANADN